MSPPSSQVGPAIQPRTHTHSFPNWMLSDYNITGHDMVETNHLDVLSSEEETMATTGHSHPGGLSTQVTSLQDTNVAAHSLWPNVVSKSQEDNPVIHDAFMGSIVPSQDLLNIESSYVREHWV